MSGAAELEPPAQSPEAPPVVAIGKTYWSIVQLLVRPLLSTLFRARVVGREHLPQSGGALIAANHQSYLDIPLIALAAWPLHVSYVARDSLAQTAWLAWVMAHCGTILIRRGQADVAAMRRIARHLELGDRVAIFPEGTRSADGTVGPFKKGAVLAARMAKVPIIPCAIDGSFEAWPRGRKLPRPARLHLRFGAPIASDSGDALESVRAAILELRAQRSP